MIAKKNQTNTNRRLRQEKPWRTDGGLVKMIVIIIVLMLIMAYLGFNIRAIVASTTFQDNWSFIKEVSGTVWDGYLKAPVTYLWSDIFIPYVWEPIVENLRKGNP